MVEIDDRWKKYEWISLYPEDSIYEMNTDKANLFDGMDSVFSYNVLDNSFLRVELLNEDIKVPMKSTTGSAGYDVFSPDTYDVYPNSDILIPMRFKCSFPAGYAMQFINKSGRAVNDKLVLGACLIDSDYRGEIKLHLFNLGKHAVCIRKGEKIAQFIIIPVWDGKIKVVKSLESTDRGEGGFGSTGL